ncbi:MAG TPA: hypothetical protein VHL80_10535 [Polyangia bacterium]|nr:hypothetical protein [Polyangia bacterium]
MSSVVYMGRGSFRMEVTPEPMRLGVVQPVAGAVTAPLHAKPRGGSDGNTGAPRPRSLFGSQVDVPLLAAPLGAPTFHAPQVSLTRATLATLCGIVLLCGIVVGTAVRHLVSSPAPTAVAAAPAAPAPAAAAVTLVPIASPSVPIVEIAPSPRPSVVSAPAPVTVRPPRPKAHAKPAAAPAREPEAPAAPAREPEAPAAPKPWVDPWAS